VFIAFLSIPPSIELFICPYFASWVAQTGPGGFRTQPPSSPWVFFWTHDEQTVYRFLTQGFRRNPSRAKGALSGFDINRTLFHAAPGYVFPSFPDHPNIVISQHFTFFWVRPHFFFTTLSCNLIRVVFSSEICPLSLVSFPSPFPKLPYLMLRTKPFLWFYPKDFSIGIFPFFLRSIRIRSAHCLLCKTPFGTFPPPSSTQ